MSADLTDTALSQPVLQAAILLYCDFLDTSLAPDPLRAAYAPFPILSAAGLTGDAEFDGFTWDTIDPRAVSIGTVNHQDGGSDTLTITLSATPLDTKILNIIDNTALYAGRVCRVWAVLRDDNGNVLSARNLYTGYMMVPSTTVGKDQMTATMEVENFLALIAAAPARTYLTQTVYDAGDLSASASAGSHNAQAAVGGGGALGRFDFRQQMY